MAQRDGSASGSHAAASASTEESGTSSPSRGRSTLETNALRAPAPSAGISSWWQALHTVPPVPTMRSYAAEGDTGATRGNGISALIERTGDTYSPSFSRVADRPAGTTERTRFRVK